MHIPWQFRIRIVTKFPALDHAPKKLLRFGRDEDDAKARVGRIGCLVARFWIGRTIRAAAKRLARAIRSDHPFGNVAVEIEDELLAVFGFGSEASYLL